MFWIHESRAETILRNIDNVQYLCPIQFSLFTIRFSVRYIFKIGFGLLHDLHRVHPYQLVMRENTLSATFSIYK